ncbi:centrosomal protein of 97 kDa isoform X2 [Zootermopsis nevadensis]|uniref:centrosomal protein of 97 kDa isoform X2 n=1 Tax=Zootermopsis nevadensis TaxID=136037 RepID=UPI000B8E57DD|nr:centrosomal protein of 97 kDa isoform X2 [Zootermopsis nevadensis]
MAAEVTELHDTLDLSGQGLKKLSKAQPHDAQVVTTLIVDNNELQRWDNIDSYPILKKLSVTHNQLLRMYGVSRLHGLTTLNLANNSILTIEGLKDLVHLKWLCLAANKIKTIEHLNTNINLEHLDLSENSIVHVSDVSHLKALKQLLLHGNRISQLRQCERHLPSSIVMLTVASNSITDLNEMSHLVHLTNLREFTIRNNPCVNMTGNCIGFDYRPFVINWCMSLKVIDGFVVDAIESLKAEWLYSQGRGRQFRVGEHQALSQYLASVCPLSGDSLESEDDRKLRLILSKAQQHQQQLREQLTTDGGVARGRGQVLNRSQSSPATRRRISNNRTSSVQQSNVSKESRLPVTNRCRMQSPDRMVNSCTAITSNCMVSSIVGSDDISSASLMTQSLDPELLYTSASVNQDTKNSDQSESLSAQLVLEDYTTENGASEINCPLQTATKMVPIPESLMSPDYRPAVGTGMTGCGIRPKPAVVNNTQNIRPVPRGSPKLSRSRHSSPLLSRQRGGQMKQFTVALARRQTSPRRVGQRDMAPVNSSEDEDSEMSASKLETIRHRAQERWQRKEATSNNALSSSYEHAAVCIQRMWRGYHTRNLNKRVIAAYHDIHASRTQEYIQKLSSDMEATRAALDSERKLQLLQMQAINALWKKVVSLQPSLPQPGTSSSSMDASISVQQPDAETVRELTQTCTRLHSQVEQLQDSMQSVMQCMSLFCQKGQVIIPQLSNETEIDGVATGSTQTDIIAVHTPQMESGPGIPFPYQRASPSTRPSSLPILQSHPSTAPHNLCSALESDASQELKQFAMSLVDGVLRTVAEQGGETETKTDKRNGTPLGEGEVKFSVKENEDNACGSREMTENGCIQNIENDRDGCDVNEGVGTGNSASEENIRESCVDAEDDHKGGVSQDVNSSCMIISTEPPSTPGSPFEQLDSPNNNQHPIKGNVIE